MTHKSSTSEVGGLFREYLICQKLKELNSHIGGGVLVIQSQSFTTSASLCLGSFNLYIYLRFIWSYSVRSYGLHVCMQSAT